MPDEGKKAFDVKDRRSSFTPDEGQNPEPDRKPSTVANGPQDREIRKAPPINFSTFVLSLSTSAAMNLGGYTDPVSGHVPKNIDLAKQSIDILALLEEKTKGNLNSDEKELLQTSLYELRMRYIEEVKKG